MSVTGGIGSRPPQNSPNRAPSTTSSSTVFRRKRSSSVRCDNLAAFPPTLDFNIDYGQGYLFGEPRLSKDG